MKVLKTLLTIFVLSMTGPAWAEGASIYRLSLHECIRLALRNNEDIKAAHYDTVSAVAQKIEATKRYVPVVAYKYRFAPVPRDLNNPAQSFFEGDISVLNSIEIEAGIPVSTFGKITVARELANLGIDAARLKQKRKSDEVIIEVYKLYQGILLARDLREIAHKGLDAVNKKVEELEKEEIADQLQILKLKAIIYQVEKKLDEANNKEEVALAMLKVQMGLEDDVDFDLQGKKLEREEFSLKSFEEYLGLSKKNRPEFTLLEFQVDANRRKVLLEKKEYLPKLLFGGFFAYGVSPGIRGDDEENSLTNPLNFLRAGVGFELKSELDFRKVKSKVEMAKAEHLKSIADKRSKWRLLAIDLKNAYLDLRHKDFLLMRAEKEQRSARQVVFLTKSNLDIGLGEKKDYLEALQSYLLIQAAVLENIYNYNTAVAVLKAKTGLLYEANAGDLE